MRHTSCLCSHLILSLSSPCAPTRLCSFVSSGSCLIFGFLCLADLLLLGFSIFCAGKLLLLLELLNSSFWAPLPSRYEFLSSCCYWHKLNTETISMNPSATHEHMCLKILKTLIRDNYKCKKKRVRVAGASAITVNISVIYIFMQHYVSEYKSVGMRAHQQILLYKCRWLFNRLLRCCSKC